MDVAFSQSDDDLSKARLGDTGPVDTAAGDGREMLLPARMVREFVFCPRLAFLEWIQREWAANADTLAGALVHRNTEQETGSLPPAEELSPDDHILARSVLLSDRSLGLIARLDLLEGSNGTVRPVDYKKGAPGPNGPREPDQIQLCVQGLLLRANGYQCEEGVLYYAATRQRFVVVFDDALIARTHEAVVGMRTIADRPTPPPPLVDSPKCPTCSLVGICLPDEISLLRGEPIGEVRRLVPARDDACPVYVLDQGASVGRSGERLVIKARDRDPVSVRLLDVSEVSLYGNVQISAQALRCLAERDIPILHHTYGGWLIAVTTGVTAKNADLRAQQHRCADNPSQALQIAKAIVIGKLRNQRTLLRRNHRQLPSEALREIVRCISSAQRCNSIGQLFGVEGMAARVYFAHFADLLQDSMGFESFGREQRPAPDPVNAVLSFLYSLLVKDALRALLTVGLDPYRGIYHQLRAGRPSLALDLMEEFRPLIGDSVTLTLLNNHILDREDFVTRGSGCALREPARRKVIEAYEARMNTLIRHPLFGYQVSYRRVLEIQARLLARAISSELPTYRPFTTR